NGDLWNLKNLGQYSGVPGADIHAPEGWDIQNTASNVIVAVIDTGVRYTHEDLAPNMWINPGETGLDELGRDKATNGVDDDGDGYIDDVHGINTLLNNGDPNDDYGHGSHVAGIIGAAGNNSLGVVGVCWRVQLMACESIDSQGNGSISDAITCIDYARSKGARIINAVGAATVSRPRPCRTRSTVPATRGSCLWRRAATMPTTTTWFPS